MMSFSKPCLFVLFSAYLLTSFANANTVRGVQQRELVATKEVDLGTAANYAILTKAGISTVPLSSHITGAIAVSPIAEHAMTGFDFTPVDDGKASESSPQVSKLAYAANYTAPTPAHLTTAVNYMEVAYTDAAGRSNSNATKTNIKAGEIAGEIGGLILTADKDNDDNGVYTFGSDVTINDHVTFQGSSEDIFIIQMTGNLIVSADVILTGGAKPENIFWQVAGHVRVMAGAHMEGILLVKTDVLFVTSSSLNGRVLAQTACDLQKATITEPTN